MLHVCSDIKFHLRHTYGQYKLRKLYLFAHLIILMNEYWLKINNKDTKTTTINVVSVSFLLSLKTF